MFVSQTDRCFVIGHLAKSGNRKKIIEQLNYHIINKTFNILFNPKKWDTNHRKPQVIVKIYIK